MKISKNIIIHPFLFAIFFIFFLYSVNFLEVTPDMIILPITISILVTIGLLVTIRSILKSNAKAGLIVSLLLIIVFSYGHIYGVLLDSEINQESESDIIRHRYMLPITLGIFILGTVGIIRTSKKLDNATTIANAISITLIVITIPNFMSYETPTDFTITDSVFASANGLELNFTPENTSDFENHPDIYYIILDSHASVETLQRVYNYDNTQFVSELEKRGFFLPKKAYSNYGMTFLSLTSSLNMGYVHNVNQLGIDSKDRTAMFHLLDNNIIMKSLQSKGYITYSINSGSGPTIVVDIADVNICSDYNHIYSPFIITILDTSILNPVHVMFFEEQDRKRRLCAFSLK